MMSALILGFLVAGCTPPSDERPPPAAIMSDIETQFLEADRVEMDFHVTAEGAFQADIAGKLELNADGAHLSGTGTFGPDSVDLWLESYGTGYIYGNGPQRTSAPVPPHLREALVIGLTRMGVLHNLARLTAGQPPDHADGGAPEWVVLDQFSWEKMEEDGTAAMTFALAVEGQPSGTALLELGSDGLPLERRQTVEFPGGQMIVVERYQRLVIHP